ncbi:MAG: phytoene desaturase family protein [Actinomycetota bacterium]|nr:phytoene desaturase family protein [Actinomycetota bacterium]
MSRIIVIGAGVGGLAVAARAAVKGHEVLILEQGARIGGKLHTLHHEGFAFDTGPSLFTLPAVYRDLFLKTGAALEDSVDLQEVEPGFFYRFADGTQLMMPGVGVGRAASAIGDALGEAAGSEWLSLMRRAGEMWQLTRAPVLQSPLDGWRSAARLTRSFSDVRTIAPLSSLHTLGKRNFSDSRLVTLLDRYATYSGSDPRQAPAALATIPFIEQTFGLWHIGGGVGNLATVLGERARERGVEIRTSARVASIELRNESIGGVLLDDGEELNADIVISDTDAAHLYASLLPKSPLTSRVRRLLAKQRPSFSGFVMLLALRGRSAGLAHHNVWFGPDPTAEFDQLFSSHPHLVSAPTIYACVPDDPLMRPDANHESWFILVNAPRHSTSAEAGAMDWSIPGLAADYGNQVLAELAARGTDVRNRVLWQQIQTPADLEHDTAAPGGSIYGMASRGAMSTFRRPANSSPIPGLYLVGGSAHPGGGLPLVGMGAEMVAETIGRVRR